MLNALLDNIYGNWLDIVSSTKGAVLCSWLWITFNVSNEIYSKIYTGKKREDIENFINEGVYKVEMMKENGLITDIRYEDEVYNLSLVCIRK